MLFTFATAVGVAILAATVRASPIQVLSRAAAPVPNGWAYVGCYTEGTAERALSHRTYISHTMTLEICAAYCSKYDTIYFGVEYGRECYCGSVLNIGSILTSETQCSFPCSGDSTGTEICGGKSVLNLYTLGKGSTGGSISLPISQGCWTDRFLDNKGVRALKEARYYSDKGMTIEVCAKFCASYPLFGVEYARECYCGHALEKSSTLADNRLCNYPCKGNPAELCGGSYVLNLYNNPTVIGTPTEIENQTTNLGGTTNQTTNLGGTTVGGAVNQTTNLGGTTIGGTTNQTTNLGGTTLGEATNQTTNLGGAVNQTTNLGGAVNQTTTLGGSTNQTTDLGGSTNQTTNLGGTTSQTTNLGGTKPLGD